MNIKTKASKNEYIITFDENKETQYTLKGKNCDFEILNDKETSFRIRSGKSKKFSIDLVEYIKEKKIIKLMINGKIFEYKIAHEIDLLLKKMGLNGVEESNIKNIVAPMPGLALNILVKEGDYIDIGQSILILEAMKMENIIKAQSKARVKKINIEVGEAIEKGQILIELE